MGRRLRLRRTATKGIVRLVRLESCRWDEAGESGASAVRAVYDEWTVCCWIGHGLYCVFSWVRVGRCGLWLIRNWRSRQDLDEVPKFFGDVVGVCDGLSYFGLHGIAKTAP